MNKKKVIIILCIVVVVAVAVFLALPLLKSPKPFFAKDSTSKQQTVVSETSQPTQPVTEPTQEGAKAENTDEALDFFKTFEEYPAHFVAHGVRSGDEMTSEFYYHATLEISSDATVEGSYFSNLDSDNNTTVEKKSNWTGKIRDNKVYRTEDGRYYICLEDVSYEKKPGTTEQASGKTIEYVCGFGLNEKADNRIALFPPETAFDSFPAGDGNMDMREFLRMMRKNATGDTLGCFLLRGEGDSCYVSISDDEAKKAAEAGNGDAGQAPPSGQPKPPRKTKPSR